MSGGLLGGCENTCRLNDVVCTRVLPWDVRGVLLSVKLDFLAIDHKVVTVDLDGALELAMLRIVLEHVRLSEAALAVIRRKIST